MTVTIKDMIKNARSEVFRKAFIRRRNAVTGQFEDEWFEITRDVKTFGKITKSIDAVRRNRITTAPLKLTVNNNDGAYNPHSSESSLWYGYLNQQRTLFRIDTGFYARSKNDYGIWRNVTYPGNALWDVSEWDAEDALWDSQSAVFIGILSGDLPLSDNNQVSFNIRPLTAVFEDFPARALTGWTTTGMTASQFVALLRDQTDGSGNFVFRPFFGGTTTFWDISATSIVYPDFSTSTAEEVYSKSVWDIIQKLNEVENFVSYVAGDGTFKFVSRTPANSVTYEFHGAGSVDAEYGHTIKSVSSYGPKLTKYYSDIELKFINSDTVTSYVFQSGSYSVSPASAAWVLGRRTLKIENYLVPNTATASTIATSVFNDVSAIKDEIEFTTSFIPHLDILDRISITYDPTEFLRQALWDQNNWGEDTSTTLETDLVWDNSKGDAIILQGDEFRFTSIEVDLDNLQNKFIAREV